MRGLPFRATDEDIRVFFAPTPISACQFEFGYDSRPTGRASVAFPSHKEALKAMERDKQTIGTHFLITNLLLGSRRIWDEKPHNFNESFIKAKYQKFTFSIVFDLN